jgi:molybdate transport system substrate-binding protein
MLASSLLRTLVACFLAGVAGAAMAGDLVVSAASSLTNAFKDIAQSYEAQHPGSKVLLNFGASGALLQQMAKGAPVDVFASADQETMDAAQQQGLVRAVDRQDFVRNALVVVAPMDAKASPAALKDLVGPGVARVALALPASVPVGRYGKHALEAAGLWAAVQSKLVNTTNVRQSLDYVARGEVDAGFVYATDAALMKDKVKTAFAVPLDRAILYPIARTAASGNAAEAAAFIAYVRSPAGQAILARYGFLKH